MPNTVRNLFGECSMRYGNKTLQFGHTIQLTKSKFWDIQVMGRNSMGQNGYGPKWSWAEMVMGRNDQ